VRGLFYWVVLTSARACGCQAMRAMSACVAMLGGKLCPAPPFHHGAGGFLGDLGPSPRSIEAFAISTAARISVRRRSRSIQTVIAACTLIIWRARGDSNL
jgi:hypothetical protein